MSHSNIKIQNKKATFLYELLEKYTAGIILTGTEIKSLRQGKASLADSYCFFRESELFVIMHIAEYSHGGYTNHESKRDRKLLLNHKELVKLESKVQTKGFTIIPTCLYINDKGYAKLDIALARGKKIFDKREDLKSKDAKRDMDRMMKI